MALNFPNPTITNPWHDGTQWWQHDGQGWRRLPGQPESFPLSGFKNVLINGDFRVNQRGFDGDWAASGYVYGYDRWFKSSIEEGWIGQRIETLNLIDNETYTLSWEGGGDGVIKDGNNVEIARGQSPLTTVLPLNDYNGRGGYVYVPYATSINMQLERGSLATEFEQRSIQQELALCQRYYLRLDGLHYMFQTGTIGTERRCEINFPVEMRVAPALVSYTTDNMATFSSVQYKTFCRGHGNASDENWAGRVDNPQFDAEL